MVPIIQLDVANGKQKFQYQESCVFSLIYFRKIWALWFIKQVGVQSRFRTLLCAMGCQLAIIFVTVS